MTGLDEETMQRKLDEASDGQLRLWVLDGRRWIQRMVKAEQARRASVAR